MMLSRTPLESRLVLSPFGASLVVVYAVAYAALHALAQTWGVTVYSLWYPVAGVRFALLWRFGERFAWPFVLAELVVQGLWGRFDQPLPAAIMFALSVALPPLGYGLGVRLVRRLRQDARAEETALSMAIAMAVAPALAAALSLPWALLDQRAAQLTDLAQRLSAVLTFLVGDVLGVLLIAPPLLWICALVLDKKRPRPRRLQLARVAECVCVAGLAGLVQWAAGWTGLGMRLEPLMLAVVWTGLRLGVTPAWGLAALTALYVLFFLPHGVDTAVLFELHLMAACIAVAAYLAGGYSDAEIRHAAEIARRDRLLFQAERLKTLRAMSVAVIHDLSQPLTTLAVEARHLRQISESDAIDAETLRFTAKLIESKSANLADLVRTLRRFGARSSDRTSVVTLSEVINEAIAVVSSEIKALQVRLTVDGVSDDPVVGHPVELQQAVVNLLRNAIFASPGAEIWIQLGSASGRAFFVIDNVPTTSKATGMGVGLIIARTIIEACGGALDRTDVGARVLQRADFPIKDVAGG